MNILNTQLIILNINDKPIVYVTILLLFKHIFIENVEKAVYFNEAYTA